MKDFVITENDKACGICISLNAPKTAIAAAAELIR